jgi:hypothetical protein
MMQIVPTGFSTGAHMFNFSKHLTVFAVTLFLASCSIQGIADKILPQQVQEHAQSVVDAGMSKNAAFFAPLKNEQMSDEEFAAAIENMFSYVSTGAEIRRDIVGASANVNSSLGKGTTKTYQITYEIQTEDGFTSIDLDYLQSPDQEECCMLTNVNISLYESSPHRVPMEKIAKYAKIFGLVFLLGLALLIFFLVRRSRRKAA